jgi:hypothetical protein
MELHAEARRTRRNTRQRPFAQVSKLRAQGNEFLSSGGPRETISPWEGKESLRGWQNKTGTNNTPQNPGK